MSDSAAGFEERFVEADGFRMRYLEAGQGTPLVHLHGAGGPRITPAHALLRRRHRVIAFEMPGFGDSAANERTRTMPELAASLAAAIDRLGVDRFDLWGTSFGGKTALWLAAQQPARVQALVLEAPGAIRLAGSQPPSGTPEEMARRLFAHPERLGPLQFPPPEIQAKQRTLVTRLRGPDRDAELEAKMRALAVPTLVLFGTHDLVTPPELGRH
jgi:pimeloyl-ACP methyl ester carboxylesterase